jgi:hypothetical protein
MGIFSQHLAGGGEEGEKNLGAADIHGQYRRAGLLFLRHDDASLLSYNIT